MRASPRFNPPPPLGGRYALRQPLGEGAFAVTYLADDLTLGRLVAVKLLRSRYGSDPAAAARFEREARAAAAVSSPYIVDVFDYGTDQGTAYIVLQYLTGPTLREYLDRQGRLDPKETVRLAAEILRGLDAIHRAGIVHRDVKPQNVLLDDHGTAHVSDFGVALWSGSETLTSHGLAVGTAAYMAPEQAQAAEVGETADLYAVGVLLYEMLTGTQPFHADNPTALMLAHVHHEPPLPSNVVPGLAVPVALEREVMRALAKRPGDRRRSASEMAEALIAASAMEAGSISPASASPIATTASMPVVAGPAVTRADTRAVPAPRIGARPFWTRSWLGPLALVLAAMLVLAVIGWRGGLTGIAGIGTSNGHGGDNLVAIAEPTPTSAAAIDVAPTATATPAGSEGGLFSDVDGGASGDDPPTIAAAGGISALTATVAATATATVVLEPTATQPSAVAAPDQSREDRERRRNGDEGQAQASESNSNSIPAPVAADGTAIQFSAGDWQGAAPVESGTFRRPAVALYGSEGPFGRAVLQFDLADAPTGEMVLTVSGLGDETGLPFPFGIEINGMFAGSSTAAFDNWHPAEDGLNGENAAWDQVRFTLPPEVFRVGRNEVAIVSLSPGDYDDRPPYLLLSDATLVPRE